MPEVIILLITLKQPYIKLEPFFGLFVFLMYIIRHCFVCHPSDSTVWEDAGIEPRDVATSKMD
jgi:hypothetical protein